MLGGGGELTLPPEDTPSGIQYHTQLFPNSSLTLSIMAPPKPPHPSSPPPITCSPCSKSHSSTNGLS